MAFFTAWVPSSSRVMDASPSPTPSGTSLWRLELAPITMPFGDTFIGRMLSRLTSPGSGLKDSKTKDQEEEIHPSFFVSSGRLVLLLHVLQDFQGEMAAFRLDSLPNLAEGPELGRCNFSLTTKEP